MQTYSSKSISISLEIYLSKSIYPDLFFQIYLCYKFILLNPSIQAYPSKSISANHISKYILIDLSCAPAEQLLCKAIAIGISRWETHPAAQCQSNGAGDTQRAEMSPAFLCAGSGALKYWISAIRARFRFEIAVATERWTPGV